MADKDNPVPPAKGEVIALTTVALSSSSSTTITSVFGPDIWKAPNIPIERPPSESEIYSYIGQVASDWSHIEHELDTIIWALAEIEPDAGACITSQMLGAYNRFKAIIGLLTLYERDTGKSTKALVTKATELSQKANGPGEQRNRIVHDPWYIFTGYGVPGQFKAMSHKDFRYGVHPVDLEKIKIALQDIKNFSERVAAFRTEVLKLLETSA